VIIQPDAGKTSEKAFQIPMRGISHEGIFFLSGSSSGFQINLAHGEPLKDR